MSIMRRIAVILTLILFVFSSNAIAQRLNFGVYSGVNLSNLKGDLTGNKYETKPGQTTGLTVGYQLSRYFSVRSEISYLNYYYEIKPYYSTPLSNGSFGYVYIPSNMSWDFSFLRFPLQIKYHTPTRLQFGIAAGLFYSFLLNDDHTQEERDIANKGGGDIYPPTRDWGYIFTTSLSYPLTGQFNIYTEARLSTGKEIFIENVQGINRGYEFIFGLNFTPQWKGSDRPSLDQRPNDSIPPKMYLKPNVGVVFSWNSADEKLGNYKGVVGSTGGIIIGKHLGSVFSIQSGVQFIRKGYAMKNSSFLRYKYAGNFYEDNSVQKIEDTRIGLDYLTIPTTFNLLFGEQTAFYVDLGFYTGFLINANVRGTEIEKYISPSVYEVNRIIVNDAVDGVFKSRDWGYLLGTGIQIPFKQGTKLDFGVNYAGGFSELLKDPDEYPATNIQEDRSIMNGNFSLQVGLFIPY